MSRVYISGPITNRPRVAVEGAFARAQLLWEAKGFTVVNPLHNGLEADADWRRHMAVDLHNLMTCDTLYMLDGWHESEGAAIELTFALARNVRIYFESIPSLEEMIFFVRAANEMRVALHIEEKLLFSPEWYAEQCIRQGYFEQQR